jgi:hypothetical protein
MRIALGNVRRLAVGLGVVAATAACTREAAGPANVVRADSSGVQLITSTGPDTTLAWRFDTIGVLTDSLGEPWIFEGVSPSRVLTDRAGRTYVLDGEPAVRRFGRDGRYERSFGRKGGAPGEMQLPFHLVQQGDSIAVVDFGRDALVRWGPDLEPIADHAFRGALERTQQIAFRTGGLWRQTYTFDSTGSTTSLHGDTVAGAPVLGQLLAPTNRSGAPLVACGGQLRMTRPTYFAPELRWDAQGARILVSTGPRYELDLYEGNRLLARVRRDLPLRKPDVGDLANLYPEGLKISAGPLTCTIPLAELADGASLAESMPFVWDLTLLSDATMWVRRSFPNESPIRVDVFGSDGAYAGTLTGHHLPVGLLPNGELLVPLDDRDSGGMVIARMRLVR